jgi:hypothetical protein
VQIKPATERRLCEKNGLQDIIFDFKGGVMPVHQPGDPGLADVKSHHRIFGGKKPCQGEADVAEADYCDSKFCVLSVRHLFPT